MWILYSILASILVVGTELVYNKQIFSTFWQAIPFIIIPILITQFALFHTFGDAPKWLLAWAVFTYGNSILRAVTAHFTGQPLTINTLVGILVIGLGVYLIQN